MRLQQIRGVAATLVLAVALPCAVHAQSPGSASAPIPGDVESPEAIVGAAYEAIARAPGEAYDWDRFRSLFLPAACLIPNIEQTGGEFRVLTVQEFIDWIDGVTPVGGPDDRGFAEEAVSNTIERYGDIAHVFSTYRKRYWDGEEIPGRGINSFQLVRHDGRWWIAGIAWDEESGAGPIPEAYLP